MPFELTPTDKYKRLKDKDSGVPVQRPFAGMIKEILVDMIHQETKATEKELGKDWTEKYGTGFDDVRIYTDKEMKYEYNDDPSRGWTGVLSGVGDKSKGSKVVLLVTYDGDGYDQLSLDAGARLTEKFQKQLNVRYGDRFQIEHSTNWAFQVYDTKQKKLVR